MRPASPNALLLSFGLLFVSACTDKDDDTATETLPTVTTPGGTGTTPPPDPGPSYDSLSGEVAFSMSTDGTTTCDTVVALEGTPYTGSCFDCAFAFEVSATATAENVIDDCDGNEAYSYYVSATSSITNQYLAFWEDFYYGYYNNVFGWGYGIDYGGNSYPGPYWDYIIYDGYYSSPGSASFSDNELTWTISDSGYSYNSNYSDWSCDYGSFYYGYAHLGGDFSGEGDLPCDSEEYVVDIWSVDANAGDSVSVTIDTVSNATAFDPYVWVNDGASCSVAFADDSFDCTYPPPDYYCPSLSFDAADSGTYQIVVASYGSCADDSLAQYEVIVDNDSDPNLALWGDNSAQYTSVPYDVSVSGSATLVPSAE
jgi:hypothetical protein